MKTKLIYSILSRSRRLMIRPEDTGKRDTLLYWQQTIFITIMLSILSLGIVASITGALQFFKEGSPQMGISLFLFYFLFAGVAFLKPIRYRFRMVILGKSIYAVGLLLLITTGPYGAGLMFMILSFVYMAVNVNREKGITHIAFNAIILAIISILYLEGSLNGFPIADYGEIWWIIVINLVFVNILVTQMIGIILEGMERRYRKERHTNTTLQRIREESTKQIRLLKSLRQMGNYLSDSRLELKVRLTQMQNSIHEELPVRAVALSLVDRNSTTSTYLTSKPDDIAGVPFRLPRFNGPFLMTESPGLSNPDDQTEMMKIIRMGEIYFGSHFYTTDQKGFLELILSREPDSIELEYLQLSLFQLSGAITNQQLIQHLEESKTILEDSYDEILRAWARILELRDIETEGHSKRVVSISLKMADLLNLTRADKIQIQRGAYLHDIGKLGIPDRILHKTSGLSEIEWDIMKKHPEIGKSSVENIPFLKPAIPIIYNHHERWDGDGYPEGLKREEIPLYARIFTLADVFDALTCDRPYRKALTIRDALSYMESQKGQIFDPDLLEVFVKHSKEIVRSQENLITLGDSK